MKQMLHLWIAILCAPSVVFPNTLREAFQACERDLSVALVYQQKVNDSWNNVHYDYCMDSVETLNYLQLLHAQYLKYPKGYFHKARVDTIVLCKNLSYGPQNRAAIPDPYKGYLFLAIDGAYNNHTKEYLIYVMHHELQHCTEYAIWNNMYYRWKAWQKANPCFFRYGHGGVTAYSKLDIDWGGMTHPRKGLINLYATTGQEEDRSELMAILMTETEHASLLQLAKRDRRLRKKLDLLVELLNDFTGTTDSFWTRAWPAKKA